MSILIGADIVPTKSNFDSFSDGNIEGLLDDGLRKKINQADYRIFNLEVPLTDVEQPILKCGPNLIAPASTVNGYKALNVDLLTLANNHIMDQDAQGLYSTVQLLDDKGISHVGAGNNLKDASKPFIFSYKNKKIGVYACAEHEFSIASEKGAGANPFDPLESLDRIYDLKSQTDFVIVLYHGGKEHYRYPSPNLQKTCRKIVEKGADIVICQHSHCIGCEEKYHNGTIIYGQGNFLFDDSESEFWQTSLLIEINDNFEVIYIPLKKNKEKVRLADAKESEIILSDFKERSNQILEDDFLGSEYDKFSQEMIERYMMTFSNINTTNIFVRIFNRLTFHKISQWQLKKYCSKNKLAIQNFVECEAHRELLLKGLKLK